MNKLGLWTITKNGPMRVASGSVKLEEDLESWIEHDPELLLLGLTVVGKQMVVEAGKLDLLGLDPSGRFVVIEIKRGQLYRETVAQGLDYTECIASLPGDELVEKSDEYLKPRKKNLRALLEERDALHQLNCDQREVVLYVVGTSKAPRLEKIIDLLKKSIPISLVVFEVFELGDGQKILLRELLEAGTNVPQPSKKSNAAALSSLYQKADAAGIGQDFRRVCETALNDLGLYPRLWKNSVMFTHPSMRNRMVFTIWVRPKSGNLLAYLSPAAIAEFYPVSESQAEKAVGKQGWRTLDSDQVKMLIKNLKDLFAEFKGQD
jgi:hypothetical protein